jgi:mannonate dehydratase
MSDAQTRKRSLSDGSRKAAFRWSHADQNAPPSQASIVSEDENWERMAISSAPSSRSRPAAKVRLACHPHDPYTPPGYRGVTRVLGTIEGLKRFVEMHESTGSISCQGTVAEMLDDPAREIYEVIRWFGERGKIFNLHFRNIKARKLDFMEAVPDEDDMDMPRALAAYRDVGYPYMLMPDHVPQIDGRDPSGVAFAYCYGYIQALIDALVLRPDRASA